MNMLTIRFQKGTVCLSHDFAETVHEQGEETLHHDFVAPCPGDISTLSTKANPSSQNSEESKSRSGRATLIQILKNKLMLG